MSSSFGQLLRQFRITARLSQEQLADLAHISVESVGSLERGSRRAPYRDTVSALAAALTLAENDRGIFEAAANAARSRKARIGASTKTPEPTPNLPLQPTSFIGRAQSVADVTALLKDNRLVTVTGSGGVGKTRLVIEIAAELSRANGDEVRFVDLSVLSDGLLLVDEIATRLGLSLMTAANSAEGLSAALISTCMLIVIDNCEHLIVDIALLVSTILRSCPHISFLATSRERLAIGGEVVYRLPSLSLPDRPPYGIDRARSYAAVELFIQRATLIDRSVTFDDGSVDSLIEVCRKLDGIPLAIEIAAARLPALGLQNLRARLKDGMMLAQGACNLPARQQTMLATIGWSYNLLENYEKIVLQRISVFVAGFTLAAAEFVCAGEDVEATNVANILSSLVDKSLVSVSLSEGRARYSVLESVRSFAHDRLFQAGGAEALSLRHAEWLAAFADWIDTARGGRSAIWLRAETAPELENARAALSWAFLDGSRERALLAGRIVGGLRTIWLTSGRRPECARWAEAVLCKIDEEHELQVVARLLRALIQSEQGSKSLEWAERAIPVFERIGDRTGIALLHSHLANGYRQRGRLEEAEAELSRAREMLSDALESTAYLSMLQSSWMLHRDQNRLTQALSDIANGIVLAHSVGDANAYIWILNRAEIRFEMGEREQAIRDVETVLDRMLSNAVAYEPEIIAAYQSLSLFRLIEGDLDTGVSGARAALLGLRRRQGVDEVLYEAMHLGALAAALRGQQRFAARLLGAAEAHYGETNEHGWRYLDAMLMPPLLELLQPEEVDQLRAEGAAQPLDAILAEALSVLEPE